MTNEEAKRIAHNSLVETGYTILNKKLWDTIGLRPTILLQTLMSIHKQWFNGLEEFYQQTDRLAQHCRCSERQIKNDLSELQQSELLTIVKKGLPCKNFYSINYDNVVKILLQDDSSQAKIARLDKQSLPDK
jgi:redox-regulated HSP33 family molecular chaperone